MLSWAKVSINLDQNGVGGISFVFGSEEKRRHERGGIWSGFVRSNEFNLVDLVDFKGRFCYMCGQIWKLLVIFN